MNLIDLVCLDQILWTGGLVVERSPVAQVVWV